MKLNWTTLLKRTTIGLTLFYIGIFFSQMTTPECEVCEDPVNIWYKVSTFEEDDGKIVKLDMSEGKSFADEQWIYIAVKEIERDDITYIIFPNGGDWVAKAEEDPFLKELQKEFDSLEEYLKANKSTSIEKEYK
tara:strand:- start:41 stop:442 length:402 start_codon:yes stop_codon:yes gene_type:complete